MNGLNKAEEYSRDYINRDFHKSHYVSWKICPWAMHETFWNGKEIHPSLAMQMGTINHDFQANLFDWVEEKEMWRCTTYKEAYVYLSKFVPSQAPSLIKRGMMNIVDKEALRWNDLMHKADEPFFWWKPWKIECSEYTSTIGDNTMMGTIDIILRHYPYEDQYELWELKAKIHETRIRWDLSFYHRMINNRIKLAMWGAFGYNDGLMLYHPPKGQSLSAFDKGWAKFLKDTNKARKGKELVCKPKYQAALTAYIPPICTYCQYQLRCYSDWEKDY